MLDVLLLRLKLWSFIILPVAGFFIGQILQFALGTRHNSKYESIVIHLITVSLMTILFATVSLGSEKVTDVKDQVLFLSISYLFVLGVILGIISMVF